MAIKSGHSPLGLVKPVVFLLAATPILLLANDTLYGVIAANPYPTLVRETGTWSLRFLVLGLALTPLAALLGLGWLGGLRRMIGLFAAFYAFLHLLIWAKDYGFDWPFLGQELLAHPYLAVGFVATVLLVPLVLTSTRAAVLRLGAGVWRGLHRLVYPIAILAWLHYEMVGRLYQPELYLTGAGLVLLLGWRLARSALRWRRTQSVLR
ncbi:MAG: ferric reductase-like transmembrane domain-containing protein [Proteobacteria bacterium]|nr:ferric reductase-like transmembrane domain-containing protein [Pseudomonadota bacterium]MBI3495777.1 ferric reductase-like transmembrane domain-containing protein [Pseudomonadota bacterium]